MSRPRADQEYFKMWIRLNKEHHTRLCACAHSEGRSQADIMRCGMVSELDRIEDAKLKREEQQWVRRSTKARLPALKDVALWSKYRKRLAGLPDDAMPAIPKAEAASAPAKTKPLRSAPQVPAQADGRVDMLAAYVEAAFDPRDADRRLKHVLTIINESAETAEEADELARKLEAHAKRRAK